ncbi:MAG: iron-regulated protein FrpC [Bacteroidetes bacterium]|nr:iron-regulated protein FrpC [Bacteroidota bacterium]
MYKLFSFFLTVLTGTAMSQTFNMATGTQTINCGTTYTFYDSGGPSSNYANGENMTLTMVAGTAGQCLALTVSGFSVQNNGNDNLTIYDGGSAASGTLIGTYFGGAAAPPPANISSSSGSLTFVFVSNNNNNFEGWVIQVACGACSTPTVPVGNTYLMNNTNVSLTCPSTSLFYDSGGSTGDYGTSENFTKTFTAPAGSCLQVSFSSAFATESCCDRLKIFDGASGASASLGTYSGTTGPGLITSSGSSLTFSFTSDFSIEDAGFEATITCVSACSGTPTGGTTMASAGSCLGSSVALSVSGAGSGCGITYQWQSAPASSGPWSNIAGATGTTYSVASGTTYYRRLTTCGANSGTSTAVQSSSATTIPCSLSTYTSATTTYSFENFTGTTLPTTDDVLFTSIVTFGFAFCYGGSQYWGGYVASNGAFVFDAVPCFPNIQTSTYAAGGVGTGYTIPSAAPVNSTSIPRNAVLGPWQDIHPGLGGTIRYYTTGTSPNRRFVVSYENIPMFSCGTSSPSIYFTGQIKLFETSNNIEIHIGNKGVCPSFNSGRAVMGLHSYDGTIYIPPVNNTAHNSPTQWSMTNTAYLFQSPCAVNNGPCAILPVGFKNFYGEQAGSVNKLYWETASESNVKEFIVERSIDGVTFREIGTVKAQNKPSLYSFNDQSVRSNVINYYKITILRS